MKCAPAAAHLIFPLTSRYSPNIRSPLENRRPLLSLSLSQFKAINIFTESKPYRSSFKKMLNSDDMNTSPEKSGNPSKKQPEIDDNGHKNEFLFSPRFRSVAAMAGWDEEALLVASLIVEDTPDRQFKQKKRSSFKTPPTNSRRKRRAPRTSPAPIVVLNLDEDESKPKQECEKINNEEATTSEEVDKKREDDEVNNTKCSGVSSSTPAIPCIDRLLSCAEQVDKKRGDDEQVNNTKCSGVSSSTPAIPCIDRLREELSCAICLEMCYEPSTTPCGHSFCKKCLRSAADRCGRKCPKCRQLISNSKYCTVNTVLWNTIQLLFPQEVEARKVADSASNSHEPRRKTGTPPTTRSQNTRNRAVEALNSPDSETRGPERRNHHRIRSRSSTTRREVPSQDEDAALALRLQREEFMEAFRGPDEGRNSLAVARANLRAMASRATNIRIRGRTGTG